MKLLSKWTFLVIIWCVSVSNGHTDVQISIEGYERCIISNGVPNHKIGQFPVKGNPHTFKRQKLKYCVTLHPEVNNFTNHKAETIGVTLTGIPIRPSTADWFDETSVRGHSKKNSSGWKLEAITPNKKLFGIDDNNAHVDKRGLYHYHGVSRKLLSEENGSLIGFAADGHEIHYLGSRMNSSWVLKKGFRQTKPFGVHDGSFLQDYEYVEGSGNLDECNFGKLGSKMVYFATNEFPFFPRCHWGNPSKYFIR